MKRCVTILFVGFVVPFAVGTAMGSAVLMATGDDDAVSTKEPVTRYSPFERRVEGNAFDLYEIVAERVAIAEMGPSHLLREIGSHRLWLSAYSSRAKSIARLVYYAAHTKRSIRGDGFVDSRPFYRAIDVMEDAAYIELYRHRARMASRYVLSTLLMARDIENETGEPVLSDYAIPKMDALIRHILRTPGIGRSDLEQLADGYSKIVPSGLSCELVPI